MKKRLTSLYSLDINHEYFYKGIITLYITGKRAVLLHSKTKYQELKINAIAMTGYIHCDNVRNFSIKKQSS